MSENRKDSKGRVLRNNEYQKKDGRYEYRFTENGIRRSVYSWRLIESDPAPKGKKAGKTALSARLTCPNNRPSSQNNGERDSKRFTRWNQKI